MTGELMLVLYAAAAMSALVATQPGSPGKAGQPGRDPELLHRQIAELVTAREAEQEGSLRKLLALGLQQQHTRYCFQSIRQIELFLDQFQLTGLNT